VKVGVFRDNEVAKTLTFTTFPSFNLRKFKKLGSDLNVNKGGA